MCQTAIAPRRWNCPRDNSMKNSGIPPTNNMVKYGIKNAPKTAQNMLNIASNSIFISGVDCTDCLFDFVT